MVSIELASRSLLLPGAEPIDLDVSDDDKFGLLLSRASIQGLQQMFPLLQLTDLRAFNLSLQSVYQSSNKVQINTFYGNYQTNSP